MIQQAIQQRNAVGIIGLLGALYSGLGWMGNLREALSEQWDQRGEPPTIVKRYGGDLVAMLGLGLALGLSFAITAIAGGAGNAIAEFLGLAGQTWVQVVLRIVGIAITLVANWLVFLWVIARLPREPVTLRSAGAGRDPRVGRVRDPAAGHDHLHRQRHELPGRGGVRPDHRSAGVRELRLALHPLRHRLGGHAARRTSATRSASRPR